MEYPKRMIRNRWEEREDLPPDLAFARDRAEEAELREQGFVPWLSEQAQRTIEQATAELEEVRELERLYSHG